MNINPCSIFVACARRLFSSGKRGLPVKVAGSIPAIELLRKQIESIARDGNQSAANIGQAFQEIATEARQLARNAEGNSRSQNGLCEVQQLIRDVMTQFEASNDAAISTGQTLAQIEEELHRVEACSDEVKRIASKARLVSFNGRIEAKAAGKYGAGFEVVASETGKLALAISKSSEEIGEAIARLTATLQDTSARMHMLIETGNQAVKHSAENVNATLDSLSTYQRDLETNIKVAELAGNSISSSISRSIVGLQYQDAISQRMLHISETLDEIRGDFELQVHPDYRSEALSKEWLEKIESRYCVAAEHQVHAGESGASSEMTDEDVILF